MIEYKNVKIFTDNIEQSALQQVYGLQKSDLFGDEPIRIMPDCHSGAGCVIGFTAPLTDKVCPNIVGVDLNCGMLCVYLGKVDIDLKKFDDTVKKVVPYEIKRVQPWLSTDEWIGRPLLTEQDGVDTYPDSE